MATLDNLKDMIEEFDSYFPRIQLWKVEGQYTWLIQSEHGQSLGAANVRMMDGGDCAKITVFDHNSVIEYPNIVVCINVTNLSDEEEKAKLAELFEKIIAITEAES